MNIFDHDFGNNTSSGNHRLNTGVNCSTLHNGIPSHQSFVVNNCTAYNNTKPISQIPTSQKSWTWRDVRLVLLCVGWCSIGYVYGHSIGFKSGADAAFNSVMQEIRKTFPNQ